MSDVRSRRRVLSLCRLWRACVWVVILAPVMLADEPPAPQPAAPPSQSVADRRLAEAKRLNEEAEHLYAQGRYREATPKARQALALRKQVLGERHPDTAASLNNLAELLQAQGDYAAAKPLLEQALAIRKAVLGARHPDTAESLNNLAGLLESQGDYAAAKPLFEQALAIRKAVLGERHPTTAQSLNNLAGLLDSQGDYAAARPLYERALAIRKQVLGERHPDTAESLNNLALLLYEQGDYAAAKPLYEQALAINRAALGERHPHTAASLDNLAELLQAQGDYAAAKPLLEQALAIRKAVLGERHPDTALSLNNLAGLLKDQGDYAAAKPLFQRAVAIRKAVLGERHPDTALSLNNLAGLLKDQGDYAAAKPLYERALAIRERALGQEHPDTATSLNNLAGLLADQGDYATARPLLERTLAILERVKGREHPDTATSLTNLACLHWAQGDVDRAEVLLRRTLEIARSNLKLAAAGQSERQQLAMTQALRYILDVALSLDRQAKHTGEGAYRSVLSWKGAVFAQQREARVFRRAVERAPQPEIIPMFDDLQGTARRLATLALAVPDPKQQTAWRRQVATLSEQKEHLEVELARRSAEFRRAQSRRETTPERVQAALPDGVALVDLLEYTDFSPPLAGKGQWKVERRLVAFVVQRDHPIVRLDLGPFKPIEQAIAAWRVALGADSPPAKPTASQAASPAPVPRDQQGLAHQVRRLVWLPLEPHLEGIHTVLVSPDGALGRLPLAALPGQKPDTYLIEERAIALVPLPQDLPELLAKHSGDEQRPEAKESTPSLLLVGDVDYGASPGSADTETSRVAARDTRAGALGMFDQLPQTREEIVAVQDSFKERFEGGRVLT